MLIKKIDTKLTSYEIFTIFQNRKNCFFLDSSMEHERLGRYSFIGFQPEISFRSKNGSITIINRDTKLTLDGDPFEELKLLMEKYKTSYMGDIPFTGGAVGFFSYDMCHHVEKLSRSAIDDTNIPDCYFGIYDGVIVIDHLKSETFIVSNGLLTDSSIWVEEVAGIIKNSVVKKDSKSVIAPKCEIKINMDKATYMNSIDKVKEYIRSGDIYQVNFTQRFEAESEITPIELYNTLRNINPAPFACYIDFEEGQILSSSPERYVLIKNGKVETRPIKGTRPRGENLEEDLKNREELVSSEKDRAELLMIVDLERNDLGKVCKTGTVKVNELFCLEEYATVYHLVSTVVGELKEGIHTIDCIKAMFPGGSITGAPKIRAMEIIDELEPTQRNIYTGSIGYIGFNGDADFNIVIRTIIKNSNKFYFQAGGGIVWDSDPQMEYEESLHKARALIEAINGELNI